MTISKYFSSTGGTGSIPIEDHIWRHKNAPQTV